MNKAKAMLIGLQVGDLLGGLTEGSDPINQRDFNSDITGLETSDITHLSLCVLRSLINCDGLNVNNLATEFVTFFDSGPKSLGNTESSAFYSMKIGLNPLECGLLSGGNGSLLRCSPLALYYDEKELEKVSRQQTSLTHTGEINQVCDILFLGALKMALNGTLKKELFERTLEKAKELHLQVYDSLLKIPDLSWNELETGCFVLDTFSSAFWGLMHTESFEDALLTIACKGDDSRACTALTGALCGAYYGSIPDKWLPKNQEFDELLGQVR